MGGENAKILSKKHVIVQKRLFPLEDKKKKKKGSSCNTKSLMGLSQKVTAELCDATPCSLPPQIIFDYLLSPTNMLPLTFWNNYVQVMHGKITACQKFRGRGYT